MNTLKGVFGETKPKHTRNFIQENMRQLREMQGYWQNKEKQTNLTVAKPKTKYQNVPSRVGSRTSGSQSRNNEYPLKDKTTGISKSTSKTLISNSSNPVSHVTQVGITHKSRSPSQRSVTKTRGTSEKDESLNNENISSTDSSPVSGGRTSRSLGCQTIDPKNKNDLYEGVIRYPSSRKLTIPKKKQPVKKPPTREMGLQTERSPSPINAAAGDTPRSNDSNKLDLQKLSLSQHSSDLDEPSEVPEVNNVRNIRSALSRNRTPARKKNNSLEPPATYQKGVVPKYLQERKEQWQKEAEQQIQDAPDPACPPGHVCLPDNQRIETLTKLKKRYEDLIQELNMMPVRTDTLRMHKRKMELEKELNKMEQAIKVFSRPKVFVKIGNS